VKGALLAPETKEAKSERTFLAPVLMQRERATKSENKKAKVRSVGKDGGKRA